MFAATFVVPTRNRLDGLRGLLESVGRQTVPVEVLVMDDAGSDALAAMIGRDFPFCRYCSLGVGRGPTFQRNRGIEQAATDIVFSVDDDTLLPSAATVEQTIAEFDHLRIAAVAIPFVNVRYETRVRQRAPQPGVWVEHAFVGASHAVRKAPFLQAGGYREHYFYMGEEGDLCLRLLSLGYVVRLGTADPIEHHESPIRNSRLADFCGRRNDIVFAWQNVPTADLPLHLAGTTANGLVSAARAPHPASALRGIASGYVELLRRTHQRDPVPRQIYQLHRSLKKHGPRELSAIEFSLAPLNRVH